MNIKDINPFYADLDAELTKLLRGKTLYREDIKRARADLRGAFQNAEHLLDLSHRINRLMTVHKAGLGNNSKFFTEYKALAPELWSQTLNLPVDMALQHKVAQSIYNVEAGKNDGALLLFGNKSRGIAHHIIGKLMQDNIRFYPEFLDADFKNLVLIHARKDGLKRLADYEVAQNAKANKKIVAIPNGGGKPKFEAPLETRKVYAEFCKPMRERSSSGDMFFTLTMFPTEEDSKRDNIPYKDYLKLYFEMCDQPWKEITAAQELLITLFNAASTVRFTNNDGTDVSMSLVDHDGEHFTFCNSVIAKNVPGSEIFSAPRRDSVNGTIVAKGKFSPKDTGDKVIENLTMHFKDGEVVSYSADKGVEVFEEFLNKNPGNRFVGELGIGTNPHMKRHVMNILLVEKVGGSFHLALGNAYTFNEYAGKPVKVDNGNFSLDHWDITTMLIGKQGVIELDGKPIMKDGLFLDPKLDILNRGWAAIPEDKRPDYWKSYKGPKIS